MTWSLTHTITQSAPSSADMHTAFVYLFDTALSALPHYTVSAHPSASTPKRSFTRTTPNLLNNSVDFTEYFWCDWVNTSAPSSLSVYEDATYTTTPGDLGTDVTNLVSSNTSSGFTSESVKFWSSDQNAKALLVTRGKSILFWEPGFSGAYFHDDSAWDGSTDGLRTVIFPGLRSTYLYEANRPSNNSGGSSQEYTWRPGLSLTAGSGFRDSARIDMNCPFIRTGNTNGSATTGAGLLASGVGNDVGFYRPLSAAQSDAVFQSSSVQGSLWLVDGRYYLAPYNQGTSYAQMLFDFGTSEPDFT